MLNDDTLKKIVWKIHSFPDLAGAVVGYHGNGVSRTIGYPSCVSPNSENIAIVVEEVALRTPVSGLSAKPTPAPSHVRSIATNQSKIGAELFGAGVGCTLVTASVVGMVAGAALEVPTAGASTLLLVASWTGLATGAIQCANGLVRVGAALAHLEGDTLHRWDQNRDYNTVMLVVDAISVFGTLSSLPASIQNCWAVITRMRGLSKTNLSIETLRRMSKKDRFQAVARIFHDASRTPDGAHALVKAARDASIGARTLQKATGLTVNHSATLVRIIRDETLHRLHWSLIEIFNGVSGIALSASSSEQTGSGSGSVNAAYGYVVNLLDAGSPDF